jgi:putative transposase
MGRLKHRTTLLATYFVTTKTWSNRRLFSVTEAAQIVINKIIHYRDQGAYQLHEFVLMPDHLHLLITPGRTTSLEKAMQLIKGGSSYEIHRVRENHMEIWQPGFHEWTIRNPGDYATKAQYIRMNPVTANLVERSEDWKFGSASGFYKLDAMRGYLQGLKPLEEHSSMSGLKPRSPQVEGLLKALK